MGSCHCQWDRLYRLFTSLTFRQQLNKPHASGILTSYIKGAPERVLAKCTTYLKDGAAVPITDDFRKAYDDAYDVRFWYNLTELTFNSTIVYGIARPPSNCLCPIVAS